MQRAPLRATAGPQHTDAKSPQRQQMSQQHVAHNHNAPAAATTDANGCSTDYQMTFQTDSTGIIVRGRRYDNSLAVRLMTEYDVPRLQVLVEIFMVTVSRDFNRQIANLITS